MKLTEVEFGLIGTPAYPLQLSSCRRRREYVAHNIRPQFASIPNRAVFTSADRAIVDAICLASAKLAASYRQPIYITSGHLHFDCDKFRSSFTIPDY